MKRRSNASLIPLMAIVLALPLALPVQAREGSGDSNNVQQMQPSNQAQAAELDQRKQQEQQKQEQERQQQQVTRQEHREKVCTEHKETITKSSDRLADQANRMLAKFDAIAARVEEFYTSKLLPKGVTVPNYDGLVAEVSARRTAAQTALTQAQGQAGSFSCTADNPKAQVDAYRDKMKAVKQALKEYRTSIKNLIVAVHSAAEQHRSPEPTASPSASPEATK